MKEIAFVHPAYMAMLLASQLLAAILIILPPLAAAIFPFLIVYEVGCIIFLAAWLWHTFKTLRQLSPVEVIADEAVYFKVAYVSLLVCLFPVTWGLIKGGALLLGLYPFEIASEYLEKDTATNIFEFLGLLGTFMFKILGLFAAACLLLVALRLKTVELKKKATLKDVVLYVVLLAASIFSAILLGVVILIIQINMRRLYYKMNGLR